MINKNFYPTPETLAHRMYDKVEFHKVKTILEPSAGKGDLINALKCHRKETKWGTSQHWNNSEYDINAIEIEPDLQALLRGNDVNVVDSDFLAYSGSKHYDLIIANFPFSDGDKHLTKALDILFSGQIVCLINAETIKNPCTNQRKVLVSRLNKLGADIEYIQDAFVDAERKTGVEVALIYVNIERSVEIDVFGGMDEEKGAETKLESIQDTQELSTKNKYRDLVASYNQTSEFVAEQLLSFYRNYSKVSEYLDLEIKGDKNSNYYGSDKSTLTDRMRKKHNSVIFHLKNDYWEKVIDLPEVAKYLTESGKQKLRANNCKFRCMEFTESNIRQFVLNLVKDFPTHIDDAINGLFEEMTGYAIRKKESGWGYDDYNSNVHYFNAWKTNDGYKANKKVILPFYQDSWNDWDGISKLHYSKVDFLLDVEKVMSYFQASSGDYNSIDKLCDQALRRGENRNIDTEYFKISIFKKGTIHLTFKDLDLLRRFNIEACKNKNFLPCDYASKEYEDLTESERVIVGDFEDNKKVYKKTATPMLKTLSCDQLLLGAVA